MTIEHTLIVKGGRTGSGELIEKSFAVSDAVEVNLDESIAGGATDSLVALNLALVRSKMKSFVMSADRDMTIKVNSSAAAVNEVQRLTPAAVTAGTFTITFDGQTTAAIQWNATAADIETALEALSNIDVGDVLVTGGPINSANVDIEFRGQYAAVNVAEVTVDDTALTGTITPSTVTPGSGSTKTWSLKADKPLVWHPDIGVTAAQFFGTADPANLYVTLAAGAASVLKMRSLRTT